MLSTMLSRMPATAKHISTQLAQYFVADKPPPAPLKPVVETLFGRAVTDNYRYMEAMGPETLDWMKAEGSYTRSVFDSIAPLGKPKQMLHEYRPDP